MKRQAKRDICSRSESLANRRLACTYLWRFSRANHGNHEQNGHGDGRASQNGLSRLHIVGSIVALTVDLVPLHWIQWTKPIEHLDIDMPGSCSFSRPHRRSLQHLLLLTLLCRLARLGLARLGLARLLALERFLIRIELGLGSNKDVVLLRRWKHVIYFPLVFHG